MGKVASNESAAQGAAASVSGTTAAKTTVTISESNISAMKTGETLANQMVDNVNSFITSVKTQADKFPALASVMAARDRQTTFNASGKGS